MDKKTTAGHITALITIVIWGTTFISTKILLADFTSIEILFMLPFLFVFDFKVNVKKSLSSVLLWE